MATTITKTTAETHENWLEKAYNALPKSKLTEVREKICTQCEWSTPTFYRYKAKGFIDSKRDLLAICKILKLDPETKKPLVKKASPIA
jgi:hypothetical protein